MNAAPTKPTTDIQLETEKAQLLVLFHQEGRELAEHELLRVEDLDEDDPSAQARRIHHLVTSAMKTAAKRGLMFTGGHPALQHDPSLRDELEFRPFFYDGSTEGGAVLPPHVSIRRATLDDIQMIEAVRAEEGVSAERRKILTDLRNALKPNLSNGEPLVRGLYM